MPGRGSGGLLRDVGRILDGGTVAGLSEAELLQRFVARRDELAFEALVRRFGPMVFGVCRRTLREASDVEDAFQATFLVLVRKAPSIRDADRLGPWIYGVARRVAGRARIVASRRESTGQAESLDSVAAPETPELPENLRGILDDELARLPSRLREPVVFCLLDGLTYEEAASRLGWPIGTVRSRLSRARALLRDRLTRRGITPPAVALALEQAAARSIHVPASLIDRTARIGLAFGVSHRTVAAAGAATLAQEILTMMSWTSLTKLTAASLVGTAILGTAWAGGGGQEKGAELPKPAARAISESRFQDEELRYLKRKLLYDQNSVVHHQSAIRLLEKEIEATERRIQEVEAKNTPLAGSAPTKSSKVPTESVKESSVGTKNPTKSNAQSQAQVAPRTFVDHRDNYVITVSRDGHKFAATDLATGETVSVQIAEEGRPPIEVVPVKGTARLTSYFWMKGENIPAVVVYHDGKFYTERLEKGVSEVQPLINGLPAEYELCAYWTKGGSPLLLVSRIDDFAPRTAELKKSKNARRTAAQRFRFERPPIDGKGVVSPPIVSASYIQYQVGLDLCLFLPEYDHWTVQKLPPGSDTEEGRSRIGFPSPMERDSPKSPILIYEVAGHVLTVDRRTGKWTDLNLMEKLK